MTPEKCPGCGAKLEPDMLACPNCPMSFPEDEGAPGAANPLKQSRYYQFLLPALFFAAIGFGVWWMGMGLFRLASENSNLESSSLYKKIEKQAAADDAAAKKAAGGGAGSSAGSGGAGAAGAGGSSSSGGESAGGGSSAGGSAADGGESGGTVIISPLEQEPPKPRRAVKEWKLRGNVYDLATLKPLAGASLTFVDEQTNQQRRTRSNSEGLYRIIVPPLQERGYTVFVEKAGYGSNYLDPSTSGVQEMSAAQRKELARGLATTLTATPVSVTGAADPVVTDFYLAPRP